MFINLFVAWPYHSLIIEHGIGESEWYLYLCTSVSVFAIVCSQNPQECLRAMKQLLCQLPKPNYATLKFIIAFLVLITQQEEVNKMNAMALAIVFGSVLFRFVILCWLLDTISGIIIWTVWMILKFNSVHYTFLHGHLEDKDM